MKRILLVDDEPRVRSVYSTIVPWQDYGFVIGDTAANGTEALEKLSRSPFDILVTDIRMPGLDGIALIELARKLYPAMAVVVLSAHDDYVLVRKAFTLGALDYFLKALNEPEDLIEVIKKVSIEQDRLDQERRDNMTSKKIDRRQAILSVLLSQSVDEIVADKGYSFLRESISLFPYCVVSISIEETEKSNQFTFETFEEIFTAKFKGELFEISPDKFLCLHADVEHAQGNNGQDSSYQRRKFSSDVRTFYTDVLISKKKLIGLVFSAGISSVYTETESITKAVKESEQVLSFRFASGKGSILSSEIILSQERGQEEKHPIELVMEAFDFGVPRRIFSLIDEHKIHLKTSRCDKSQALHEFYFPLYMQIFIKLKQKGFDARILSGEERYMLETLSDALTLDDMHALFRSWIERLMTAIRYEDTHYTGDMILKVRMYINDHYTQPLKLEQIAKEVGVHPNYLSRLFTERVGKPLFTYINELRVEQSKRQLRSTDMKIYEIAYANGFDSHEYYCRTFKRITGTSPNSYRFSQE